MSSNPPIYIAHALGEINHLTYTNSKAAFENNIGAGFSYFEADINLTKDNNTVLYHHKKPSSNSDLWQAKKCHEFTWQTLSTYRYGDRYPVQTFKDFICLIKKYPDTKIVLDFKSRRKKKVFYTRSREEISYVNVFLIKTGIIFYIKKSFWLSRLIARLGISDSLKLYPHKKVIKELLELSPEACNLDRFIPQVDINTVNLVDSYHLFPLKIWKPSGENIQQAFELAHTHSCLYISLHKKAYSESARSLAKEHGIRVLLYGDISSDQIASLKEQGAAGFYIDRIPNA